ncbi:class I SAM-dependent methyltransferase [Streptomyces sp. NPDC056500]|uniref:class I SAM-dependent methyltransferase n=1 Tax=Streptomyces sp. NPDC056500 TaxID=3345840 RepID=UPI0036C0868E
MAHNKQSPAARVPALAKEITAYYERGEEDGRLRSGAGRLEFWRTQDVLRRLLPPPAAQLLDVGGGSGIHAQWLAADGYLVELIDPMPLHVKQAAQLRGVTARIGDARALDVSGESVDVVLLLGPLYHLTQHEDRVRALTEAHRVLRPGGVVFATTINRFAALHGTLHEGLYFAPDRRPHIEASARNGLLNPPEGDTSMFTTAYLHEPSQVRTEFTAAGLIPRGQYGLEGAAWLMGDVSSWLDDPERRELVLRAMRLTESVPSLLGVSGHLLTAGSKPMDRRP